MNEAPQNEPRTCSEPVGSETIASFPTETLPGDLSQRVHLAAALERAMDASENESPQPLED